MAMTKKEQARLEELLTACALRTTMDVEPDIPIPEGKNSIGFITVASSSDSARVEECESSSVSHGTPGRQGMSWSQGGRRLYSTKLMALRGLRREVEKFCAERLRRIDRMIEQELDKSAGSLA